VGKLRVVAWRFGLWLIALSLAFAFFGWRGALVAFFIMWFANVS
jgi:hypothetical protein